MTVRLEPRVNPECTLLLLSHAFNDLGAARNDGSVRDSTYFSILAAEWPRVRAGLQARLG